MPKRIPMPSRKELELEAFRMAVEETMNQLRQIVGSGQSLMLCEREMEGTPHFCTREAMTNRNWVAKFQEQDVPEDARYITGDGITAFCQQYLAQDINVGPVSEMIREWFAANPEQMNLFVKEIRQEYLNRYIDV